jgi:hypothetical protein
MVAIQRRKVGLTRAPYSAAWRRQYSSPVDVRTLDWLETLGRVLLWGAAAVLALAIVGAIAIASSESSIPGFDELTRENRGVVAVFALGAGLTSAGVLAGLGALLRLNVAEHRRRQ